MTVSCSTESKVRYQRLDLPKLKLDIVLLYRK